MTDQTHARVNGDDFVGARFGDFVTLCPLANGELATLYLARRAHLQSFVQPIAIHVFHPHLAGDASLLAVLKEEARVASHLDHPGIGRLFDFGEANGTFYVATQYVFGERLATVLRMLRRSGGAVRLPPQLVTHIFIQACDALHSAYFTSDASGLPLQVAHGGLSPSRLHIGYDGAVHVRDFGMPKIIDHLPTARANTLQDRLPYCAPEQILDEAVDLRADVWSLGVMLRESLSGRRVFAGRSPSEIMHAVLGGALPAWPEGVPQGLRAIAERAMQPDPRWRYPNPQAMTADLRALWRSGDRSTEQRMATWMRAFFAERIDAKRALLRTTFRGSLLDLSSQIDAPYIRAGDFPALASPVSQRMGDSDEEWADFEQRPEPNRTRSYIRLAGLASEAALDDDPRLGLSPSAPAAPPLPGSLASLEPAASRPGARAVARQVLALTLGTALLGIAYALSPAGSHLFWSIERLIAHTSLAAHP